MICVKSLISTSLDASRTGYAEAKSHATTELFPRATDASRTGYAEAKISFTIAMCFHLDESRTGYAEAKIRSASENGLISGCKPHRLLCKAKANVCRKAGNI